MITTNQDIYKVFLYLFMCAHDIQKKGQVLCRVACISQLGVGGEGGTTTTDGTHMDNRLHRRPVFASCLIFFLSHSTLLFVSVYN